MPIDDRTTNRSYQLPNGSNLLVEDLPRLRAALQAIDADVFARYTKVEVDQLLAGLINSAPGALDTLNELAAAIGSDPNFATTITNLLAQKANSADVYTKGESDARYVQGQTQSEMVFIATTNQSVFTLSTPVINKPSALVTVDGVVQPTSEYSLNQTGTQLTLSEGVQAGTVVRVLALGVASQGAPADDTVTTVKLRDRAVTAMKIAVGAVITELLADGVLAATPEGRAKMADSFVTPAKLSQPLTLATAVPTTSGTAVEFTSIPSWARRITLLFNGVSTNGFSNYLVQIGSGSFVTTGYQSNAATIGGGGYVSTSSTNGFLIYNGDVSDSNTITGQMVLVTLGLNNWTACQNISAISPFGRPGHGAGSATLTGALDRIRITTANGTDQFDAGSVNILYE